jgi:hypothetical protein
LIHIKNYTLTGRNILSLGNSWARQVKFLKKFSKVFFFLVNIKIDNNCNVLRGVYDRLYSDICIYQGSAMNIFFDYYSMVPVLCTMMAIVFGLGNFLFFNNEKRASGMVQTVGPITSILRISAMNPSLIWTRNLRNTPAWKGRDSIVGQSRCYNIKLATEV